MDTKSKRERYVFVKDVVEKVKGTLNSGDGDEPLPLEAYKSLSWAASDANLISESLSWTEGWLDALETSGDNANAALVVLCKVRLAVVEMRVLRSTHAEKIPHIDRLGVLERKVAIAVEGLENVARGRKHDLEMLLQEAGQLRRNSLGLLNSLLHDGHRPADSEVRAGDTTKEWERKVRDICNLAFKSVVQFCRKYMAMGISEVEHSRLQPILAPAIDSIFSACLWGFDADFPEAWENADALLWECGAAIKAAERESPRFMDTFYEKISNVYYQIYLLCRKSSVSEGKATRALRRSIASMDQRPTSEIAAASIPRKYQILGTSYLAAREYRRSEEAFISAIQTASTTGLLNELGERANRGESVEQLVGSPDKETAMVAAVVSGLVRIATRKRDGIAAELRYQDPALSIAARGILLEWSLSLAIDQMHDDGSVVRVLGERLLDIYELEEMPLRRSRVVAKLLGVAVDQPTMLDPEAMQGLGAEILEWANGVSSADLDEDSNLETFKDDIIACCSLGLGFSNWLQGTARPDLVLSAFGLWKEIIKNNCSWGEIASRTDNARKVIERFEMAVEFFDMKGETELKLAALKILLEFRRRETPANYDGKFYYQLRLCGKGSPVRLILALITTYTRIGLQYLRLGYSGKAGISMGKARSQLEKQDDITTTTRLEWHLAYIEYLVSIGNFDRGLQYFHAANVIASQDEGLTSAKASGAKIMKRVVVNRVIADAAYVTSLIAFEKVSVWSRILVCCGR